MALEKFTKGKILDLFRSKHGDRFGYGKLTSKYYTLETKITINCPSHGDFETTIKKHIECRETGGCHRCANEIKRRSYRKSRVGRYCPMDNIGI